MKQVILDKYFFQLWGLICFLAKFIGIKHTSHIFHFLGFLSSYIFKKEKNISATQLKFSKFKDADKIAKNNFIHISKSLGEIVHLDSYIKNKHFTYNGLSEVESKVGNGAVALSAHIGCFELLAAYHGKRGSNLYVIGRNINFESAQSTLEKIRTDYGAKTVWREDNRSLKILAKGLKTKGLVAALIDQDTTLESKFSNFFELDAAYPIAPIKIGIRYQIPIFTSFIYRVRNLKHHIWTEEIKYDPNDENAQQKVLDEYNNRVQNLIKLYPSQWIWWHRRWRRREGKNGEQDNRIHSTNEYLDFLKKHANQ